MTELFIKTGRVEVADRRIDFAKGNDFDLAFTVEKKSSGANNRLSLQLFNLDEDTRNAIERADRTTLVSLWAGYRDPDGASVPPQIFQGTVHHVTSERNGPDIVTDVESRSGGRQVRRSRIAQSFAAGAAVETALRACADALGVGLGNLNDVAVGAQLESTGSRTFSEGLTLDGPAWEALQQVTRSVGLQVSIQNGELQFRRRGQALQGTAVLLREGTGLLEAKSAGRSRRGAVIVRTMLIPDLWPGRRVEIDHNDIQGTFRIVKARYLGDTQGDEWTVEAECRPLEQLGGEA